MSYYESDLISISLLCHRLFGNYESLDGGNTKDALVDMSGGVGENLDVADYKSEQEKMELFKILQKSYENRSLMSASISAVS